MKIKDLFGQKKVTISCEIFPPKKDTAFSGIFETVDAIQSLGVDFISVTYGAGGSTSKKRWRWLLTFRNAIICRLWPTSPAVTPLRRISASAWRK